MAQIFANNAKSVLSASIGTASTTIPVADATSFPTLTGADFALVTLQYQTSIEIVQIVAPGKTGNNLIVGARAQEGTAAQTFPLGANVQGRITAGSLGLIQSNTIVAGDIATTIHNAGVKVGPADADEFGYSDSASTPTAFGLKKFTWASLKAALLSYFSTLTGTWAISTTGNAATATTATTANGMLQGNKWIGRTSAADNNWAAIAWNGTVFAAVASSGTGNRVMTTPEYAG